jgi:hypothetical protein
MHADFLHSYGIAPTNGTYHKNNYGVLFVTARRNLFSIDCSNLDLDSVADQLRAEAGREGRPAGETCPLRLVALGGESSDETVVCQHAGADRGTAGSDGELR